MIFQVTADDYENNEKFKQIRKDRGYTYCDFLELSKDKVADYDAKLKIFFSEHLHADEEIRFILDGSGYFDVRDRNDEWIRILVRKNDLLVLPAGIYHRFTLDNDVNTINFVLT